MKFYYIAMIVVALGSVTLFGLVVAALVKLVFS